jgi:formylglycine-generating enzyme required for sulfatase activity
MSHFRSLSSAVLLAAICTFALATTGCRHQSTLGPDFEVLEQATGAAVHPKKIRHRPSGIVLLRVEPGSFRMGSPDSEHHRQRNEAQRLVEIETGFYLAETETTAGQWKKVMGTEPPIERPSDSHPVSGVAWHATRDFLSRLAELGTGSQGWSLPNEMQWEYACRAGTDTPFFFGEDISTDQANYHGQHPYRAGPKQEFRASTVEVKSFAANAWGFYDMHGNLWEWCEDRYVAYPEAAAQVNNDDPGAARPIRGGGFEAHGDRNRCAARDGYPPSSDGDKYGFRVAFNVD